MRVKGFVVSGQSFVDLCKVGLMQWRVTEGAPSTARFRNAWFDAARQSFIVSLEDESFEDVPEGCEMPIIYLKVES